MILETLRQVTACAWQHLCDAYRQVCWRVRGRLLPVSANANGSLATDSLRVQKTPTADHNESPLSHQQRSA